ncbi:MAG TPA: arylamine N-acetyltransferase [Thermoanaerobaculia bacterium]|nr:arylamine N-acetyltransferase [Thermoanaerobaculia bacterium]
MGEPELEPLPLDDILEALDLPRAAPGVGLLERLFVRFNARVPFETASKILRDGEPLDAADKPRRPALFWREHLESGTGGTCFARVAAFDAMLGALGFRSRKIVGRVVQDFDHAALAVETDSGPVLCDVGFPLPALLPVRAGEVETPLGPVRVAPTARGLALDLGGVPEGPQRIELLLAEVPEPEYARLWRATFRPGSKFLAEVGLRRDLENRVLRFARGRLHVDDAHARLSVPLPVPRAPRLQELFGVDRSLLEQAFARVGDPGPESGDAALTAYLEISASPEDAFSAIETPAGYRRLLAGVAEPVAEEALPDGFLLRLRPPGPPGASDAAAAALEDRVAVDRERLCLDIERTSGAARSSSFYRAERRDGRSYLLRGARFPGTRDDLLRNDSLRGRLAGGLAVDLLAWSRLF